jgi:serine/threonine-protein kinase
LLLAEGTVVAERFRLVRELGQGGMGSVWQAHHMGLDIPCAVKFIHAEVAQLPEIRQRFEREAKAAAQLRSPNVVQILDYGVSDSIPYIAMEFLEGEDLAARLKRCDRLPAHETASIVSQVARALVKAHAAGLVHRDLKPENVYLVHDDDREIAKVLDFGIAKSNTSLLGGSDHSTKTGSLLGTPHYMSPEQAQGTKAVDFRSDLWSLAVLAYRCVTGKLPFDSEALGDLLVQIIVNPVPVPSQVAPGVPRTFDAWWVRAAARDPAQRFQSAKELADALSVALGISQAMGMPAPPQAYPSAPPPAATVVGMPSYAGQGGYQPVPGHTPAPTAVSHQSSPGTNPGGPMGGYAPPGPTAHAGGYTAVGTPAFNAVSHAGSYSGVGSVQGTTGPAVSRTMTGHPAAPSSRNKVIAIVTAAGLLLGGIGAVVMVRRGGSSTKTEGATAGSAIPMALPTPATAATPTPITTTLPPEPIATAATAPPITKPPPVKPTSTPTTPVVQPKPPVVIPPPPPPTREKVKIPAPPPPGKDFGF